MKKRRMGELERRLFAYLQLRGKTTVRAGELAGPLRLSAVQERNLLSRLAKAGWIARVQRGLYLAPDKLPLGGIWTPDAAQALNALMAERGGRYQICGLSAFNFYDFDDQIPNRVIAYNNRIYGERTIGAVALILIKVADRRLGATGRVRMGSGEVAIYSSRARTLVDAVYDWSRFGTLPRAFDWIRAELRAGRVDAADLVRLTLRYGDVGTIRRIGALLDRLKVQAPIQAGLERALKPSTSLIPWIPTRPKRGRVDRRWGIVWNDHE
jgi:predicted transcriptional regulator of viral defense system